MSQDGRNGLAGRNGLSEDHTVRPIGGRSRRGVLGTALFRSTAFALAAGAPLAGGCVPWLRRESPQVVLGLPARPIAGIVRLLRDHLDQELPRLAEDLARKAQGTYRLRVGEYGPAGGASGDVAASDGLVGALTQAQAAGTAPDLILLPSAGSLAAARHAGLLASLGPPLRAERRMALDTDYHPGPLEATRYRGEPYALPLLCGVTLLDYDPALFAEHGLAPPSRQWTWQSLVDAAIALTGPPDQSGVPSRWGLDTLGEIPVEGFVWQNGGEIISRDGRRCLLAEAPAKEALQFVSDLFHRHRVGPVTLGPNSPQTVQVRRRAGQLIAGDRWRVAMRYTITLSGAYSRSGAIDDWLGHQLGSGAAVPPRQRADAVPTLLLASLGLGAKPANPPAARRALLDVADALGEKVPGAPGIPGFPARRLEVHQLQRAQPSPDLDEHRAKTVIAALERSRSLSLDAYLATSMQVLYQHVRAPLRQGHQPVEEIVRTATAAIDAALQRGE